MNQRGFSNIILVVVALVVIAGVAVYLLSRQEASPQPTDKLASSAVPSDSGLVDLTIISLSKTDSCPAELDPTMPEPEQCPVNTNPSDGGLVRVDNIIDYDRNPRATFELLTLGNEVGASFVFSSRLAKVVHIPIAVVDGESTKELSEESKDRQVPKSAPAGGQSIPREGNRYIYSIYSGTFDEQFETLLPGANEGNKIRAKIHFLDGRLSIGEYEVLE